jgi:hypothetical protein
MKDNHTSLYRQGFRFYVYRGPGMIEYFRTIEEAQAWADETGGNVGTVD